MSAISRVYRYVLVFTVLVRSLRTTGSTLVILSTDYVLDEYCKVTRVTRVQV